MRSGAMTCRWMSGIGLFWTFILAKVPWAAFFPVFPPLKVIGAWWWPAICPSLTGNCWNICCPGERILTRWSHCPEPTHALYSKACLPYIEARLRANDLKISRFYHEVQVNYLTEETITRYDPELRSFFNINSPDDLAEALTLAAAETI